MKNLLVLVFVVLISCSFCSNEIEIPENVEEPVVTTSSEYCVSSEEKKLHQIINEYRKQKGLEPIALSASLSYVAQSHSKDLDVNRPDSKAKCNLHSWSSTSNEWNGCCYTDNHSKPECMWDKPRELTNYTGDGYEIAASFYEETNGVRTGINAAEALKLWKSSTSHNNVILNRSVWKKLEWSAMGVGIYGEYATVWFGQDADAEGVPPVCN